MNSIITKRKIIPTVLGQNTRHQGPHPKEIYNYIQQLYLDARNAWQTTYTIRQLYSNYIYNLKCKGPMQQLRD